VRVVASAVANNGTESTLLCLCGTIPTVFSGVTYQTPVKIWMPQAFPAEPPMCYVEPTPGEPTDVTRAVHTNCNWLQAR
jgi:hypothetical protein